MATKSLILSSAGLRNINIGSCSEDHYFCFQIGQKQIVMNSFYADFISPIVASHHRADPTLDILIFDGFFTKGLEEFASFSKEVITEEIAMIVLQLASGVAVDVNQDQAFKLRFFSIIIGNEELYQKVNEIFPTEFNEGNIELYLQHALCCYYFSKFYPDFNFSEVTDFLANNFYALNQDMLLQLPKSILYMIISNSHLKLDSEDSLLDFVLRIFQKESEDGKKANEGKGDELSIIEFYEKVDFAGLSENRLLEFLDDFDVNEMSTCLWIKFYQGLVMKANPKAKLNKERYVNKDIFCEYDPGIQNNLKGIIHYLTKECGGNVAEKHVVDVSGSSTYNDNSQFAPKNAVDLDSSNTYFASDSIPNSWLKYDFKDKKIVPTHYTIRTRRNSNIHNPSSWIIEVANKDGEWKTIDSQNNVPFLNNDTIQTYKINKKLAENEGYRYIRFKQLNNNNGGSFNLYLAGLEFFGKIID